MNFDLSASQSAAKNGGEIPVENKPVAKKEALPDSLQIEPIESRTDVTALLSLGSPPCINEEALNGQHAELASCASACALLEANVQLEPISERPRTISFADDHQQPLTKIIARSPPRLQFDIVRCTPEEFQKFIFQNRDKGYLYKIWDCMLQLLQHSEKEGLGVDDHALLATRLKRLGTQESYSQRPDRPSPQRLAWPPYELSKPERIPTIRQEISRAYTQIVSNLLATLSHLHTQANACGNEILKAEIRDFLADTRHFSFQELLIYAVLSDHVDLLESCFSDFEGRVRETVDLMLENSNEKLITLMICQAQEAFTPIFDLASDILILHKLQTSSDTEKNKKILENFFNEGGDVLQSRGDHESILQDIKTICHAQNIQLPTGAANFLTHAERCCARGQSIL